MDAIQVAVTGGLPCDQSQGGNRLAGVGMGGHGGSFLQVDIPLTADASAVDIPPDPNTATRSCPPLDENILARFEGLNSP